MEAEIIHTHATGVTARIVDGEMAGMTVEYTYAELQSSPNTDVARIATEAVAAQTSPVGETMTSDDFGGQSSGNATGDVGSVYADVLSDLYAFAFGEAEEGLGIVQTSLATCVCPVEEEVNECSTEEGVDPNIDVAAFIETHGAEIDEAMDTIGREIPEDARVLTTAPDVDPATVGEAATTAVGQQEEHLNQRAGAYAVGAIEGLMEASGEIYPDTESIAPLKTGAETFSTKLGETITQNEEATSKMSASEAAPSLPDGILTSLEEGKALFAEHGDYTSQPDADLSAPAGDPVALATEAATASAETKTALTEQKTDLVDQKSRVDSVATELGTHETSLQTDKAALDASRQEVSGIRESASAEADSKLLEADASAAAAMEGIQKLQEHSAKVKALTSSAE